MIKQFLKPNQQQKLKITLTSLDNHRESRFQPDVNRILNNLEQEVGINLSVVRSPRPADEPLPQPQPYRKPQPVPTYIVPMQRVRCFEIQEKTKLEQQIKDLYIEKKYREKGLRKGTPKLLRGGFHFHHHSESRKVSTHVSSNSFEYTPNKMLVKYSDPIDVSFERMQQSTDLQTQDNPQDTASVEHSKTMEQCNQTDLPGSPRTHSKLYDFVIQQQPPDRLPKLQSSLRKKGTRFSKAERRVFDVKEYSPGPGEYEMKRFAEQDPQGVEPDGASQPTTIYEHQLLSFLRKRSQSLLPVIEKAAIEPSVKKLPPKQSDPLVDRFGVPLYPLSQRFYVYPGPGDYEPDVDNIAQRIDQIREEQSVRAEIKQWLTKQTNYKRN